MQKLLYLFLALVVLSCKQVKQQETLNTEPIEIIFEGPLFEGSNTGQFNWDGFVQNWLKNYNEGNQTAYQIASAQLLKAEVEVLEQSTLTNVVLQLASKNQTMKQLAVLNPIEGKGWLEMKLGSDLEIGNFLTDQEAVIVADAGLSEDIDDNVKLRFKLSISISLK